MLFGNRIEDSVKKPIEDRIIIVGWGTTVKIFNLQRYRFALRRRYLWFKNLNFNDITSLLNRFHNKGVM